MGSTRIDHNYCIVFILIHIQGFVTFAVVFCIDSFSVSLLIIKFESWSINLRIAIL